MTSLVCRDANLFGNLRRDLSAEAPQGAKVEAPVLSRLNFLRDSASEPVLGIAKGDTRGRETPAFLFSSASLRL